MAKRKSKYEGKEVEVREAGLELWEFIAIRDDIVLPEIMGLLGGVVMGMWAVQLAQLGPKYKKAADLFTPEKVTGLLAAAYRLGIIFGRGSDEKEALEELDRIMRMLD
jgi:hypothetical protein